jgi:predicted lipoprotein with Yx(FWY)xxD motif
MDRDRLRIVVALSSGAGVLFAVFVLVLFLSGGVDPAPPAAKAASRSSAPPPLPFAIELGASDYGPMLFDADGRALYAFTSDPRGESVCTGDCAAAWPPYLARGRLRAGGGTRRALLGTAKRPDGTLQVAYGGRPLYYYVGDREPGQVLCQNVFEFGGTWLVLRANGSLVR